MDLSGACDSNPAYGTPHLDCPGTGATETLCECNCHQGRKMTIDERITRTVELQREHYV